ncbi:holin, partial [Paenibacillus macerans]
EAVSILENCSVIGVPLPELLTKRLGITDDKNIKN